MPRRFTCSFTIRAVQDGSGDYWGKYEVMNAAGDIIDGTDKGSVHVSAVEALHAAEARARSALANLELGIPA